MMVKKIFIMGGSASGKTFLSQELLKKLGDEAILISQDSFYKDFEGDVTERHKHNFDVPKALDFKRQIEIFKDLKIGQEIEVPVYDFTESKVNGFKRIKIPQIVIFEGLFTFQNDELAQYADLRIFVDTPSDTRLSRRIKRDMSTRGRKLEGIIDVWEKQVEPAFSKYILPKRNYSDLIVPWCSINSKAVKSVISSILYIHD